MAIGARGTLGELLPLSLVLGHASGNLLHRRLLLLRVHALLLLLLLLLLLSGLR
jgi:hypothetical protein